MASIPLNTFKNVSLSPVLTSISTLYQTPAGVTSIILMAQVANIVTSQVGVSFYYNSFSTGLTTTLVNEAAVAPNDSLLLLPGKLILQQYDTISIQSDTVNALHFIASILESANQ